MFKHIFTVVLFVLAGIAVGDVHAASVGDIPIQHHGRVKPLSSFAQDTLQFISGKTSWEGKDAAAFLLGNMNDPLKFLDIEMVRVDHIALKKQLSLPMDRHFFSYKQLKSSIPAINELVRESRQLRNKDSRPSALQQAAERLYQRLLSVQGLVDGDVMTVIPADPAWLSPFVVSGQKSMQFKQFIQDYGNGSPAAAQGLVQWIAMVHSELESGAVFKLSMEVIYNRFQPLQYAWIFYLGGFLGLMARRREFKMVAKGIILAGFLAHSLGLLLRLLVLARPPVANMYETMIYMDWVLMVFVGIFVLLKGRSILLSCGALVSALILLYARLLPVDQSMDVLAPVLRSNYWLTIHVMTIVSSYSLFAFAMAVAHRHLFMSVNGKMTSAEEQISADSIDRLLQIGLVALGAGTVLGGIWANESWGRFWGWDPKETWAFITFMGYMAILHLRFRKMLTNFALAVSAILGFLLVLMTWYGVNFVLGRGMHSYGSGSGGAIWIVYFLIFEAIFLGFIAYRKNLKFIQP